MSTLSHYKDWHYITRITYEDAKVAEYTIQFYRARDGREWYDELRYDSHETRRGRTEISPHFHMKLMSSFKSSTHDAVEQIKQIIDNYLSAIGGVIES
jgi:hypothetical protein